MTYLEKLKRVEDLYARISVGETAALQEALDEGDWTLIQSALMAIRRYPMAEASPVIFAVLAREAKRDLYGQKEDLTGSADAEKSQAGNAEGIKAYAPQTIADWMCRWRVKQAACLALGAIAAQHGRQALSGEVFAELCRLAVSETDDYQVRAAACFALAAAADPAAAPALEKMATNDEFCTRTEAKKALAAIRRE